MPEIMWEDILQRDDLIGGDLETQENGIIYRGPVEEIVETDGILYFRSSWVARLNPDTGEWENWPNTTLTVSKQFINPQDLGDGRILFYMPCLGMGVLFPVGSSKLDPDKVKGLQQGEFA